MFRMRTTTLLLAFVIGLFSFQSIPQAYACSCAMPGTTQESIDNTDVIFSGTVDDVRASGTMQFAVSITVDEDWKGLEASERSELTVYTAKDSAACGYAFTEGEEYLVYGYRDEQNGAVRVGLCSATKPLDQAEEDLALLSGDGWACTMDAKACPDGSYVGRQGPNCEFAACPGEPQACTKELKICPDGTGVGRTGPNWSFAPCPGEEEPNCAPYVCANGTTHPRCSEDGHVINYFAAPCHMDGGEVTACSEDECGEPRMAMPNWTCPDDSVGGPVCERAADGACGWVVRDCPNDPGFSDVPTGHENADGIFYVKSHGLVQGYADGTYKPDATINRAEFVKILMGAFEDDDRMCKIAPFADVDQTAWYATFAHAARCNGVVEGYADGTFRPANTINFAEAAKIIAKAFKLEAVMTVPACEGECPWYRDYVMMLEMKGAIPMSITRFEQQITRGEMAEMIYRLRMGGEQPSRTYGDLQMMAGCDRRIAAGHASCE